MSQLTSPMRKPKCLEPVPTDFDHWSGSLAQKEIRELPFGIDVKHLDDARCNVVEIFYMRPNSPQPSSKTIAAFVTSNMVTVRRATDVLPK
jgi:hypothetical protein